MARESTGAGSPRTYYFVQLSRFAVSLTQNLNDVNNPEAEGNP
jgi:hypothetical protein